MTIKTPKILHEDDWRNLKKDYAFLKNDKDISERMDLLTEFFKRISPKKILDIGCGSGYLGYLIKKLDCDVAINGFDVSEYAIKQADSYDKVYCLDLDKHDIPEEDGFFDMVVCAEVIEHIYDVDHCLAEIKRLLKPGGKAIVTTPNFGYWKYRIYCLLGRMPKLLRDPRHIHTFNHKFLAKLCYNNGFDVAYTVREKNGPLAKAIETIFNKTIILILTKRNYE